MDDDMREQATARGAGGGFEVFRQGKGKEIHTQSTQNNTGISRIQESVPEIAVYRLAGVNNNPLMRNRDRNTVRGLHG